MLWHRQECLCHTIRQGRIITETTRIGIFIPCIIGIFGFPALGVGFSTTRATQLIVGKTSPWADIQPVIA
jgi:hypothetical protein